MLCQHRLSQRHGKRLLLACGKRDQQLSKTATPETRLQLGSVPQLPAALRCYVGNKSFFSITCQRRGLRKSHRDTICGPRTRSGCKNTFAKKGKKKKQHKTQHKKAKEKTFPFDYT